jgi:integrase
MASAILAHVEGEVARGRPLAEVLDVYRPKPQSETGIDPLLARWLDIFRKRTAQGSRGPRTLREYERWADPDGGRYVHFSYWYGRSILDIDRAELEEWSFWLSERGLAAKTVRNVMAGFRSFMSWVAENVLTDLVVPRFPWPEIDDHRPTILSDEMQANVLSKIPWHKRGIFLCLAYGLLRPGEARVLRVRDYGDDEIHVARAAKDRITEGLIRGLKSRNTKTVPVVDFMLSDWLTEHVTSEARLQRPDSPLFPNPDGRREGWWSETAMRRTWGSAAKKAGVAGVSLYEGTKHSTATRLKAGGMDDRVLALLMGHRDQRSVAKYAKLDSSVVRLEIERANKRTHDSE